MVLAELDQRSSATLSGAGSTAQSSDSELLEAAEPRNGPEPPSVVSPRASEHGRAEPREDELAALMRRAQEALAAGDDESALEASKKALLLLPEGDTAGRASAYVAIGTLKQRRGRLHEAERNFEKALAYEPGHRGALEALWSLAIERKDWRAAAARGLALTRLAKDPAQRVRELLVLAHTLDAEGGALPEAIRVLEAARLLAPRSDVVLARLRSAYERAGAWNQALDVMDVQCTIVTDPRGRAALRFEQANIALRHLSDEARARRFLEATLGEDPAHEHALRAFERLAERRGEWQVLEDALRRALLHARASGDAARAFQVAMELGALRRDRLYDGPGALLAYEDAIALRPTDVTARALRADLLYAGGDEAGTLDELEAIAMLEPTRPATYRHLFTVHQRARRLDGQWLAAMVLEELGAADVDQELFLEQFRPVGPIHPRDTLEDEAWDAYLRAPGFDPIVAELLRIVGPVAIALRKEELRAEGRKPAFDPLRRLPRHSTATIVRAFEWASRVLDVNVPALYLLEAVPGDLAMVQADEPTVVLSPALLHGIAPSELVFLAGRHMAYLRPEHYPLVFYPTLDDVSALVVAALGLALDEGPPKGERARKLRKILDERLDADGHTALRDVALRLAARDGRVDLAPFLRSVELTAGRVGLLLAADLRPVLRHVESEERFIGGVTPQERRADLLAFAASRAHLTLREALHTGAASPSSLRPPTPSLVPPAPSMPAPAASGSMLSPSIPPLPPVRSLSVPPPPSTRPAAPTASSPPPSGPRPSPSGIEAAAEAPETAGPEGKASGA